MANHPDAELISIVVPVFNEKESLPQLVREIADGVLARFGVQLVPEPVFVGVEWTAADPNHG